MSGVISISIKSAARSDGDPHKERERDVHGGWGGLVFFLRTASKKKVSLDTMGYEIIIAQSL